MWDMSNLTLNFFQDNDIPFWDMANANIRVSGNDTVLSNEDDHLVLYRIDASGGTIDMTGLTGTFSLKWFDPRNGGPLLMGTVESIVGELPGVSYGSPPTIPEPADGEDWALLIRKLP